MCQLNNFVTISFLLFFLSAFADDECVWCPLGSALGNGIVQGSEWLWNGAADATGAAIEGVQDLLQRPSQPPQPNLFLPPDTPTVPDTQTIPNTQAQPDTSTIPKDQDSQTTDGVFHLNIFATPEQKPPVLPVLTDDKCNPGNLMVSMQTDIGQRKLLVAKAGVFQGALDTNSCGVATAKIIWPQNCGDIIANVNILNALIAITGSAEKVGISSNRCGTFFWTASLTEEQMEKLTADTPGIDTIVPNTTGQWNRSPGTRRHIERRATVLVESDASPDLSYISTPQSMKNPDYKYARFPNAGSGVTVYIVDDGAARSLKEFTTNNVIKGYMYGLGSSPKRAGASTHGTCVASKVGGFRDGVVNNADLIIVQIEIEISSLLDALKQIVMKCEAQVEAGQYVHGYTVVQIAIGHQDYPYDPNTIKLTGLIQELVESYQVIVVAASKDLQSEVVEVGKIDVWKQILHREPVIPIILVGAIDMRSGNPKPSSTNNANDLTVGAPDDGWCASAIWWNPWPRTRMPGNSIASGVVSGLAADLLSRGYIRQHLGLDLPENRNLIPQLVRDYIVSKAYPRRQATALCIWNGLYFDDPLRLEP